jgi:Ni,Fe-hydrogenase III large subunit
VHAGVIEPGHFRFQCHGETVYHLEISLGYQHRGVERALIGGPTPRTIHTIETLAGDTTIGLVGVAARASGLERDVRHEFPYGIYRMTHLPICTWDSGDCFARAYVRWLEVQQSLDFIQEQLDALPEGPIASQARSMAPNQMVVSLTEGWRGEIGHVVRTDDQGRFGLYKVVDPSFHNWFGLAMALRDQQISDFPLCNKSFNLSYCGHDL